MIHVVHVRDRMPDAVYIGRECYGKKASPLANPIKLPKPASRHDRMRCLDEFEDYFDALPLDHPARIELTRLIEIYKQTKCLVLECWCAPKACHGESIKRWILAAS
jgi:hypothetical protein